MAHQRGDEGTLTYDPFLDAGRRFPDWVIRHRPLLGVPEVMCASRKVILLECGHSAAERRCSLAHAVAHIDLGHQVLRGVLSARQELAADRLAARRLLPVHALADAACWAESTDELAHELDVDVQTLQVRARWLPPAERAIVLSRLGAKVLTA